jgi:hypothetical protein
VCSLGIALSGKRLSTTSATRRWAISIRVFVAGGCPERGRVTTLTANGRTGNREIGGLHRVEGNPPIGDLDAIARGAAVKPP